MARFSDVIKDKGFYYGRKNEYELTDEKVKKIINHEELEWGNSMQEQTYGADTIEFSGGYLLPK
ncbi:hypothetical protein FACS189473_2510 [Spirochaetia bacterium]|nr:hypothetical protein FACS189473_2510 [Spirochaetia bacterium]